MTYRQLIRSLTDTVDNVHAVGFLGDMSLFIHPDSTFYKTLLPIDGTMDTHIYLDNAVLRLVVDPDCPIDAWEIRFNPGEDEYMPYQDKHIIYKAQEYINVTPDYHIGGIRPRVRCADGFEVSIQASVWHCCQPRVSGFYDYVRIEVGYPSAPVPEWAEWKGRTTAGLLPDEESTFLWVPIEEVDKVLMRHGGIVERMSEGLSEYTGEEFEHDITHDWGEGFPHTFTRPSISGAAQGHAAGEGEATAAEEPEVAPGSGTAE